jgi:hypothetical protein
VVVEIPLNPSVAVGGEAVEGRRWGSRGSGDAIEGWNVETGADGGDVEAGADDGDVEAGVGDGRCLDGGMWRRGSRVWGWGEMRG